MKPRISIVSAVIVASLISGSLAYASTVTTSKVTACADKKSGVLRVANSCKSTEKSVPLISGSVQLAPVYKDADNKPIDVLEAVFGSIGEIYFATAIVNGKIVRVAQDGKVYPIGSNPWYDTGNPVFGPDAVSFLQSDCSGVPFLWFANGDTDNSQIYANLATNKNYAGYFLRKYSAGYSYYKITDAQVAFSDGLSVYHKTFNGCQPDNTTNQGGGYSATGFTTLALLPYTGSRIPDFRVPITVAAQ